MPKYRILYLLSLFVLICFSLMTTTSRDAILVSLSFLLGGATGAILVSLRLLEERDASRRRSHPLPHPVRDTGNRPGPSGQG